MRTCGSPNGLLGRLAALAGLVWTLPVPWLPRSAVTPSVAMTIGAAVGIALAFVGGRLYVAQKLQRVASESGGA